MLNWDRFNLRYIPASKYTDLTGLNTLPSTRVEVTVEGDIGKGEATVRLEILSSAPAVFISVSLVDSGGKAVLPLICPDNYVMLWKELAVTVKPLEGAVGTPAVVRISGRNVEQVSFLPIVKMVFKITDPCRRVVLMSRRARDQDRNYDHGVLMPCRNAGA